MQLPFNVVSERQGIQFCSTHRGGVGGVGFYLLIFVTASDLKQGCCSLHYALIRQNQSMINYSQKNRGVGDVESGRG